IEGPARPLTRLQTGHEIFILLDTARRVQQVDVRLAGQTRYRYLRQGEGFALQE
ncbi:MAG: LysM-like peptidoglycan-binding domain-containing protein, partial [Aeromonas sp.]